MANEVRGLEGGRGDPAQDAEQDNARLKRIVAEQALDISMLKDVAKGANGLSLPTDVGVGPTIGRCYCLT